jgi:predicted RNase H-like nuclease (RuvC/YqgF family)
LTEKAERALADARSREVELTKRSTALEADRRELARTAAALQEKSAQLAGTAARQTGERKSLDALATKLAERESALARRERQADERSRTLVDRDAALTTLERELEERAKRRYAPPAPPGPRLDQALLARIPQAPGAWTIEQLETFTREHRERFPDRYDEWQSYLFYLREFADASGRLPQKFDALLEEVFAPVAARETT